MRHSLLLLIIALTSIKVSYADWQLVKDEQAIQVYTQKMPASDYKAFKATMRIHANIEQLMHFINRSENCPLWQYRCLKMQIIGQRYLYKLSELPWPLHNRYTVMEMHIKNQTKTPQRTLYLKNIKRSELPPYIAEQLPDENNTVQMRVSDGYWQFSQISPTQTDIIYQMHGDPAGVIPASLANQGVINAGFETLKMLREQMEKDFVTR